MDLLLTPDDLRKVATILRRPGVAVVNCETSKDCLGMGVRLDLAEFVDVAAKLNRPVPITVQLKLGLTLLDTTTLCVQLFELDVDKSELPMMLRPLLGRKLLTRKLFEAIPKTPGLTVDTPGKRVMVALPEALPKQPLVHELTLKRLEIADEGLRLSLNFSGNTVE